MTTAAGGLYFHSPCFDGIVSAVLAWDFLEARYRWGTPALAAVNYDLRGTWLSKNLARPAAVVDFLYHPDAWFWADHHVTAFLDAAARKNFENRREPTLVFDERAGSCAALLWEHLAKVFGHRTSRYSDIVVWADKIDAARYSSVGEALDSEAPALRVNLSLALGANSAYCEALVRALRDNPLEEVAALPEVRERTARGQALILIGLDRFKRSARLEDDGIVVFDVDASGTLVSRYAPYYFFPEARYSAGITRFEGAAKITAMRNPWKDFPSVPLGQIAEHFGGGGHQRVGSVALRPDEVSRAPALLNDFLSEIRRREGASGTNQRPMIERLNFYDVYGYLIPGLALLGVVWFPFWFVAGRDLPAAWSSALVALVLSYILGHLLQRLAREAFPQGRLEEDRSRRYPSDYILDSTDPKLTDEIKTGVVQLVQSKFGLDIAAQGKPDARTRSRRQDAFFVCRRVLIQQGVGSYAEQFEGMYALMRGLAAVSTLSFTYHVGWAVGRLVSAPVVQAIGFLLLVCMIVLTFTRSPLDHPRVFWTVAAALLVFGALLGYRLGPGPYLSRETIGVLIAISFGSLFMARQFHASYQFFGVEFAATVYRDVYALERWSSTEQQKKTDSSLLDLLTSFLTGRNR